MTGQKLADAKVAALTFVQLMDLARGRDQVAVVRFDLGAELVVELSADQAVVSQAIQGLEAREGTHIDRGLLEALAELQSPRTIVGNTPVVILLTDGQHMGAPREEVAAAAILRDAGIALYIIGLGSDVDEPTLVEMAGARRRYSFAPDSSHLMRIYAEVAHDIDCPVEDFWGTR
jgi:Mg-chelatase subunit ChlD